MYSQREALKEIGINDNKNTLDKLSKMRIGAQSSGKRFPAKLERDVDWVKVQITENKVKVFITEIGLKKLSEIWR